MDAQGFVRYLFPDIIEEAEIQTRAELFQSTINRNGVKNRRKSDDYCQGYGVGEFLFLVGESYDPKGLDAQATELLEDLPSETLPVKDAESFTQGLADGFSQASDAADKKENEGWSPRRPRRR